jgi:Tfp pilus assembly protein PilO
MNRRVPLVAAALAVVLVLAWYLALWKPETSHVSSARARTSAAKVRQQLLNGQLVGLLRLEKDLPSRTAQLNSTLPAFPEAVSIPAIIDQINRIAVSDHIAWTNESQSVSTAAATSPTTAGRSTATAAGGSASVGLSLTVAGSYADMGRFVTSLERLPRLIVVDSLGYTPSSSDHLSAAITARAFYDAGAIPATPTEMSAG